MLNLEMSEALTLLDKANSKGVTIKLSEDNQDELIVNYSNKMGLDKELLEEVRRGKNMLLAYFKKRKKLNTLSKLRSFDGGTGVLSYGQEGLWFVDRHRGSGGYHIPALFRVRGDLDVGALEGSFRKVVERHGALHTVIRTGEGGIGVPAALPAGSWQLLREDGTGDLSARVDEFVSAPFDLERDHMLRALLVDCGAGEWFLSVVVHHIASDAWSVPVIVRDLEHYYSSEVEGREASLGAPVYSYSDYARFQRDYVSGALLEEGLSYWRDQLGGLSPLALPTDYPRPRVLSGGGGLCRFDLSRDDMALLEEVCRREGVTLFMFLLSVFKVLLYRYTGERDICVGSAIANRQWSELEDVVGYFMNTLALRSDVGGDPVFGELLERVKGTTLSGYHYQDIPFEKVADAVSGGRDVSRSPVYQVMFDVQEGGELEVKLPGVELEAERGMSHRAKYELTFSVLLSGSVPYFTIEYSTDLYGEDTVMRMGGHYTNLLRSAVAGVGSRISELEMLSEGERRDIEEARQGEVRDYGEVVLPELLRDSFLRWAKFPVLIDGMGELSYGELDRWSDRIGQRLSSAGVGRGSLVPICTGPGRGMLAGILGIFKAGGAYVPVDPGYPEGRIAYILDDTGSRVVLGEAAYRELFGSGVVFIGLDAAEGDEDTVSKAEMAVGSEDLAYVIYTSGSTGSPKGVMIEHGSLVNYLLSVRDMYMEGEDGPGPGTFVHLPYTFDASVTALFLPLLKGRFLVFGAESGGSVFGDPLFRRHAPYGFIKMTPSHIRLFGEVCGEDGVRDLARRLVFGGEELGREALGLLGSLEGVAVYNEYGPTETTVGSTVYGFEGNVPGGSGGISIGHPIGNTRIYILDGQGLPCAAGVYGELAIGGRGLSRGYLKREDLNTSRFGTYIKAEGGSERIYMTGDLCRRRADGLLEYGGRIDGQLKIRGHRVEPGEIEGVLLESGMATEAVVLGKSGDGGRLYLMAYVVCAPGAVFDEGDLRDYLGSRLPEYMIPGGIMLLEEIPLTGHGKIDIESLLGLDVKKGYEGPRDVIEGDLVKIWEELLGIEGIGIHDNFFAHGGDSIITIQVVSRARRKGHDFQVGDIFEHQTIAELSAKIRQGKGMVSLREEGSLSGMSGLLPIQQWYLDGVHSEVSHFNQSVLLRLDKRIDGALLDRVLSELLLRHDALRYRYVQSEEGWEQYYGDRMDGVAEESLGEWGSADLADRIAACGMHYQRSLDIYGGSLVRGVLMHTGGLDEHNRFLLIIHHLAVDGVSWRILLEDIQVLLEGHLNGRGYDLGQKGSSYRQWYGSLASYGSGRGVISQLGYWEEVSGLYEALGVETGADAVARMENTVSLQVSLSSEETEWLLRAGGDKYGTELQEVLVGALAKVFTGYSGRRGVVIGMEGHGREGFVDRTVDTSRTVGWFTNLYPVYLQGPQGGSVTDWVKGTKESLRQVPDKGMGYGVLKYINREPTLQGGDPWDIVFNYLGQFDNLLSGDELLSEAGEFGGGEISGAYTFGARFVVTGMVREGCLQFKWRYSDLHYGRETVSGLAGEHLSHLSEFIGHCRRDPVREATPWDYGLSDVMDCRELDSFVSELAGDGIVLESVYRLSGLQEGMLFHGLYDGSVEAYTEQFSLDVEGLDAGFFLRSWEWVIDRHSILRTGFWHDRFRIPVQCVYTRAVLPVEELDYSGSEDQADALRSFEERDRSRGFTFREAPLMRLSLIYLGGGRHRVVWTHHHMILDGWSMPVLMGEVLENYQSLLEGKELPVREEDRYGDYIGYLSGRDMDKEESYWRGYLDGVETGSLLPFISVQSGRNLGRGTYREHELEIGDGTWARARKYVKEEQITVNTLVQGVWAYILSCYTGRDEVVYGITVSGRPESLGEVESRLGMYINTVPFCGRVKRDLSVTDWLKGIQRDQGLGMAHQHSSLGDIRRWTGIKGDLFDSLLVFENIPIGEVLSSREWGLEIKGMRMHEQTNYPLTLKVDDSGSALRVKISYNADLLEGFYVEQLGGHFAKVLGDMTGGGDVRISELELLTGAERDLLESFGGERVEYPVGQTLPQLFSERARECSGRTAVIYEGAAMSYGELEERSNRLGHYLRKVGVCRGTLVPLFIERGMDMVVGILGIQKAGGAYVPLDTGYPAERIAYILEDTDARHVVSSSLLRERLGERELVVVELDGWEGHAGHEPATLPEEGPLASDLAYVIYTSGTTGRPKGVMVEHKSVVNFMFSMQRTFCADRHKSVLSFTSYSFDIFNLELYLPLLFGGTLFLTSGTTAKDGLLMKGAIAKYRPDIIQGTPSMWQMLLHSDWQNTEKVDMLVGGEPLNENVKDKLMQRGQVWNMYGPTETTIWSTFKKLSRDEKISIGRPIDNTDVYIYNNERLVPIGVPGMLYIGGDGLARGYLKRPELSSEVFTINHQGDRIYRTGDYAKWLPNGNLEYLGRRDDQIKLHGHRIELTEIETVILETGMVSQAIVVLNTENKLSPLIVAYIVLSKFYDETAIQEKLKERLPRYMLPMIVPILSMPLSTNGKVDKQALPRLIKSEIIREIGPLDDFEASVLRIWSEVLALPNDQISVEHNFFDVGGNSISIIRVQFLLNKTFNVNISVAQLFELTTIKSLANFIHHKGEKAENDFENKLGDSVNDMDETLRILNS